MTTTSKTKFRKGGFVGSQERLPGGGDAMSSRVRLGAGGGDSLSAFSSTVTLPILAGST